MISSMTATDDGQFIWSSVPQFKKPGGQVIAYAWVVELADATCHLLYEFAEQYGLGSFAGAEHPDPDDLVHGRVQKTSEDPTDQWPPV